MNKVGFCILRSQISGMNQIKAVYYLFLICSIASFGQDTKISFLALGDSYTVGTSEIPKNSWPNQFAEILSKKGYKTKTRILADAGWTSDRLLREIEKENIEPNYDLVSLLIGVNNQYRRLDFDSFKKDFITLLDKSVQFAQNDTNKVIVLSIPDWSITPFARFKDKNRITKELKKYNSFIKQETEKRNIIYVEITQLSRNAEVNSSLIASDSLHLSKKMYKMWAKKASKKVLKKLD